MGSKLSLPQNEDLDNKLKRILIRYDKQNQKEIMLKKKYRPSRNLSPDVTSKKATTKENPTPTHNIINIVNNVGNIDPDKKIDLKMNINQYDIKYYVGENSKNDITVAISDIDNSKRPKSSSRIKLQKKVSIIKENIDDIIQKSHQISENFRTSSRNIGINRKDITLTSSYLFKDTINSKLEEVNSTLSERNPILINCLSSNEGNTSKIRKTSETKFKINRNLYNKSNDTPLLTHRTISHTNNDSIYVNFPEITSLKHYNVIQKNQERKSLIIKEHIPSITQTNFYKFKRNSNPNQKVSITSPKGRECNDSPAPYQQTSSISESNKASINNSVDKSDKPTILEESTGKHEISRVSPSHSKNQTISYQENKHHLKSNKHLESTPAVTSYLNIKDIGVKDNKAYRPLSFIKYTIKQSLRNTRKFKRFNTFDNSSISNESCYSSITAVETKKLMKCILFEIKSGDDDNAPKEKTCQSYPIDPNSSFYIKRKKFFDSFMGSIDTDTLDRIDIMCLKKSKLLIKSTQTYLKKKIDCRASERIKAVILNNIFINPMTKFEKKWKCKMEMKIKLIQFIRPNNSGLLATFKENIIRDYYEIYEKIKGYCVIPPRKGVRKKTKVLSRFGSGIRLNQPSKTIKATLVVSPMQLAFLKFDNSQYVNHLILRDIKYNLDQLDDDKLFRKFSNLNLGLLHRRGKKANSISPKKKKNPKKTESTLNVISVNDNFIIYSPRKLRKGGNIQRKYSISDELINFQNNSSNTKNRNSKTEFNLFNKQKTFSSAVKEIDFKMLTKMELPSFINCDRKSVEVSLIDDTNSVKVKRNGSKTKTLACSKDSNRILRGMLDYYNNNLNEKMIYLINEKDMMGLQDLLRRIGDIDLQYSDNNNNSFVHWAVLSNSPEICQLLIEKGCNYNLQNNDLNTPLHLALSFRYYTVVNVLLKFHADEQLLNKCNMTPWQLHSFNCDNC